MKVQRFQPSSQDKKRRQPGNPQRSLSLPSDPNIPSDSIFDYCWCLFGAKGVGKTSLAAQFRKQGKPALIFQWEFRRKGLNVFQIPKQDEPALDWPTYTAYIDLLVENRNTFPTVVIDTIDRCYVACMEHVCHEAGVQHPNDMRDYGALWAKVKREFDSTQFKLLDAGICVIYISHDRKQQVQTKLGEEYELVIPTCQGIAWEHMKAVCDFAFYYGYHRQKRILVCRGGEEIWSGCGADLAGGAARFIDPDTKKPLAYFHAGNSAQDAYNNLVKAFHNQLKGGVIVIEEENDKSEPRQRRVSLPSS